MKFEICIGDEQQNLILMDNLCTKSLLFIFAVLDILSLSLASIVGAYAVCMECAHTRI